MSYPHMKKTCAECPWRKDVATGRFPPERYMALQQTCVGGGFGKPSFACHKSPDGKESACAGFLITHGLDNNSVRMAAMRGDVDVSTIKAAAPLYADFRAMAKANRYDPGKNWNRQ